MFRDLERNRGLAEINTAPIAERLMHRLGYLEIKPEEKEYLDKIRAGSWAVRNALRLGPEAKGIIAPNVDPASVDLARGNQFKESLRQTMLLGKLGNEVDFTKLFPKSNPVIVQGIIRRVIGYPHSSEYKYNLFLNTDHHFAWVYQVMKAELEKSETVNNQASLLIVTHTGATDRQYIEQTFLNPRKGIQRSIAGTATAIAESLAQSPYPGEPILKAEAIETGRIGRTFVKDYREVIDDPHRTDAKVVFIAGTCSFDVVNLPRLALACQTKENDVVIGGLAATDDPEVIIQTVPNAHVFIGEVEGAMDIVLKMLDEPHKGQRFIFHRGLPPGEITKDEYLLVNDEGRHLTHVYINVPRYVDIDSYYSPAREKSGRLALRLRCNAENVASLSLFGKEWEGPGPIGPTYQTELTFGCPAGCIFCSTVESLGRKMRRKSLETIELELQAMEGQLLWLGDQNFGGQSENDENWSKWMNGFFDLMIKYNKRLACQVQLSFFGKVAKEPNLAIKVKEVMAAALVGLEQPEKVKGATGKDPAEFETNMRRARAQKVIIFGTCVFGLSDVTVDDFNEFLDHISPDILAVFPFIQIPGSPGVPKTEPDDPDPLNRYKHINMIDPTAVEGAVAINREFYQIPKIIKRAMGLLAQGYPAKRVVVMLAAQIGADSYISNRFTSAVENARN